MFLKLQYNSSEPIWDGSGQPRDIANTLKGAGLLMFSNMLNQWIPVIANLRPRVVISQFTQLACRTAEVAVEIGIKKVDEEEMPAPFLHELPEENDTIPAFQVFQRTLPTTHGTRRIGVRGCRVPTIAIPLRLLRMWFPDSLHPKGLQLSVKIDGRNAKTAEEVRIFVRLEDHGVGQNIGKWFDLLHFSKTRKPSLQVWQYIQKQQLKAGLGRIAEN